MNERTTRLFLFSSLVATAVIAGCGGIAPLSIAPSGAGAQPAHASGALATPTPTPLPTATTITLGASIGTPYWPDGDSPSGGQGKTVDGIGCDKHMSTLVHIHVHLDIFDSSGRQLQMPWAIGIVAPWGFKNRPAGQYVETGTCYYDLHSHDRDGVIHYETADHPNLTLGTFFDIWGEPLSNANVAGLTGTVWVMYGTKEPKHMTWSDTVDPRSIPLIEHEYVELAIDNPPKPSTLPTYRWTY